MKTTIRKSEDILTIAVEGRLDTQTATAFGNEVKEQLKNAENLVFDFDKLDYISSTGLRVLLFAQKEMNKRGGSMSIVNVTENVYEIMKEVGFTGISEIFKKE